MLAKVSDQRACNTNAAGCKAEKEFYFMMRRPCPTAQSPGARTDGGPELAKTGHTCMRHMVGTRTKADTWRTQGEYDMADIWRTRFGGRTNTRRTQGGHMADKRPAMFGGGAKRTQGSQGGHMAETRRSRRTQGGQTADKRRTHGGQCGGAAKAESRRIPGGQWRTHGRQTLVRPGHIAANLFPSKRGPHNKLLGEKLKALENKIRIFALVDIAKTIRATELPHEDLSPNGGLALKARICRSMKGDHSVAFHKLSMDGVLLNWWHTLNQLVEHGDWGWQAYVVGEKISAWIPWGWGACSGFGKSQPLHKTHSFSGGLIDNQQVAGKNTIKRQMLMLRLVTEIFPKTIWDAQNAQVFGWTRGRWRLRVPLAIWPVSKFSLGPQGGVAASLWSSKFWSVCFCRRRVARLPCCRNFKSPPKSETFVAAVASTGAVSTKACLLDLMWALSRSRPGHARDLAKIARWRRWFCRHDFMFLEMFQQVWADALGSANYFARCRGGGWKIVRSNSHAFSLLWAI